MSVLQDHTLVKQPDQGQKTAQANIQASEDGLEETARSDINIILESEAEAANMDEDNQQSSAMLGGNTSGEVPSVLQFRTEVTLQNFAFTAQTGQDQETALLNSQPSGRLIKTFEQRCEGVYSSHFRKGVLLQELLNGKYNYGERTPREGAKSLQEAGPFKIQLGNECSQ